MTFNRNYEKEAGELKKTSLFSKSLNFFLKTIIIPLSRKENREDYKEQIDEVSNFVKSSLENLLYFDILLQKLFNTVIC